MSHGRKQTYADAIRVSQEVAAASAAGFQVVILVTDQGEAESTSIACVPKLSKVTLAELFIVLRRSLLGGT